MPVSYSAARFAECAQQIADQARELAAQGWTSLPRPPSTG